METETQRRVNDRDQSFRMTRQQIIKLKPAEETEKDRDGFAATRSYLACLVQLRGSCLYKKEEQARWRFIVNHNEEGQDDSGFKRGKKIYKNINKKRRGRNVRDGNYRRISRHVS